MIGQPGMYVVAESHTYHFLNGNNRPHLVERCSKQCGPAAVFTAMAGSTVAFQADEKFSDSNQVPVCPEVDPTGIEPATPDSR
jgi:hypothetical protein